MNDLIIIKQLPIIEEQLKLIKGDIESKVSVALAMVCTEDTVKTVKDMRAALTREFNALEAQRKEVKTKVLSPYEQFELVYKDCVSQVFKSADGQLKAKIDEVENGLKEQKKVEVLTYFKECVAATGIDFISFEQTGVTVTLAASKKSLKDKTKAFVDKIADELALIDTQEHKAEILVEYKQSLNVAQAMAKVTNRHKAIADEREREAERKRIADSRAAAVQRVEEALEVAVPTAVPEAIQAEILSPPQSTTPIVTAPIALYETSFKVTKCTLDQLKALKQYLNDGGYSYESI